MKPILKKAAAALAIKEGIEKVQEMRKPKKPGIVQRLMPFTIVAAVAGLGLYFFKSKSKGSPESHYSGSPSNSSAPTSSSTRGSF